MVMKTSACVCAYGARVILKHLKAFEKEWQGVHTGAEDIEHIHRMRVASRRLRATLPLFERCFPPKKLDGWMKAIRRVTRALGAARDADVQIARVQAFLDGVEDARLRPGLQRLLLRLRQARMSHQPAVTAALEKLAEQGTLDEIKTFLEERLNACEEGTPPDAELYALAHAEITRRLETFLSYDAIVPVPERVAELHEMRIATKWLRYTVETFAPLYPDELSHWLSLLRNIQERLGQIHDDDVWLTFLPAFLEEERQRVEAFYGYTRPFRRLVAGVQWFEQTCREERERLYHEFVSDWQLWKDRREWEALQEQINLPRLDTGEIYPPLKQEENHNDSEMLSA